MASAFSIANYTPPGPVAAAFIRSDASMPFIMGPVGAGKTMATIFKALRYTATMPPCKDGIIRAKGAVVRQDYRTLYKTTLSSWFRWFPRDFPGSEFTGGADRPATHALSFVSPRGRKIQLTVEFQALGANRIEDIMRGWEGSWAWLNEADLLDEDAPDFVFQRTTRFPPKKMLTVDPATGDEFDLSPRVFGDLNPPGDPDHWIVKKFIDAPTEGRVLFQQPSGLSPQAENKQNLAKGYYESIVANNDPWHVHRFVHGKVGYDRSGMPVYPEFDPALNIAPAPLVPDESLEIHLGLDISGLHPGAVIVQRDRALQIRVLEEIYGGRIGPTRFADHIVSILAERYGRCMLGASFYDPSNDYGADKEGGDLASIDIIRRALVAYVGGPVHLNPAPTNEVPVRIEAVRNQVVMPVQTRTGLQRGLVTCPKRAPMINKGFMSHYRYKLLPNGQPLNGDRARPEKNEYANPHDGLQYVVLGLQGYASTVRTAAKGFRPGGMAATAQNFVAKTEFRI